MIPKLKSKLPLNYLFKIVVEPKKDLCFVLIKAKSVFKNTLKSKTPFESFLISQVEKTNENIKEKLH